MISGLVVLSNPIKYCYPFVESIKSFLPVCDEIVVSYNTYSEDGSRSIIENIDPKVRIVTTMFDLQKYGWISYGVARSIGYQACKGDIVLMFDADGILHEKDEAHLKELANRFIERTDIVYGYWGKYRFYTPTRYWDQHKHSGWYNKKVMGDSFDFFRSDGKGAPNTERIGEDKQKAQELDVILYGYEHVWDSEEAMKERITNYGMMHDRLYGREVKTKEEYWDAYIKELIESMGQKGKTMDIDKQPAIIQNKLRSVNEKHFGYNFFNNL
jgi:glycosyltransferase involved in cell wall biosynthesis